MALTIEELNIQIEAECTKATTALDVLIGKLKTVQSRLNGLGGAGKNAGKGMEETAKGATKASNAIDKQTNSNNKATKSTQKLTDKLVGQISKFHTLYGAFKSAAQTMGSWFNESNDYIETLNLFEVAMGDGAAAAKEFAETVQAKMGIESKEWMNDQAVVQNLATGFGVSSESAGVMSQNLTQLSYDLSSIYNTDVETAFDKLSSAMSGQVKGLREFGIDTTVATLQEYALSRGIDKSVRSMSQAEKSMLRYNYIMEQSRDLGYWNDMAKTIITPANSLRILTAQITQMKRAFGNIISVVVTQVIPYVQAFVELVTEGANKLAELFGFELPDLNSKNNFATGFEDAEDSLEGASDKVKEIKKQLMGFDELNIISNSDTDSSSTSGSSGSGNSLSDMDLLEYDFLKGLKTEKLDEAKEKLIDILWYIGEIAAGLLLWKLSKTFLGSLGGLSAALGLVLLIDSIRTTIKDGLDIGDIVKGAIGGALLGAAIGFKLGGWPGALGGAVVGIGVALSILGITSMFAEGVNVKNTVTTAIGLGLAGAAIGFTLGGWAGALGGAVVGIGVTLIITGIKSAVDEGINAENISSILAGTLGVATGILTVVKYFNKSAPAATPELQTATDTIEQTSTGTSALTGKLKSFATNMGWGLLILLEVAAAAIIFVGAIAVLGWELEQVGKAWQPVIDNGPTIASAIGMGTALLLTVGVVTGLLGTAGGALAAYMGIGIAVLALMGAATLLFVAEIWAIGKGLEQVGLAWQPVLDNGETIKTGIATGTALLIAIGVVTAALGVATVASAGALPIAIGLGTALLVELSLAFVAFVESLAEVANQLSENLSPALEKLNAKLPGLSTNMKNFTDYMKEFAGHVVSYTKSSAISGFASTVDSIIKFFTKDPIKSLANDADKQYKQSQGLNEKLRLANPELATAISLMKKYYGFLEELETLTGENNNISLASGMFVSMKEVGKNLVTGFVEGMKSKNTDLKNGVKSVLSDALTDKIAQDYGKSFGQKLNTAIKNAINIGKIFTTISISLDVSFNKWVSSDKKKVYEALGLSGWPTLSWSAYEQGGFPTEGQMFIAREAGPELVGSIGRKTAVANNDQIVSGIESGVYRAVMAANSTNKGGSQTIRIINEIDGDVVGEKVIQYHNGKVMQTGASPLLV